MADVVIIGGGLSGIAAAWELEQQNISYTLIEVKGRLGGSIISEQRAGFIMDGGPFILRQSRDWDWLDELGIPNALDEVAQLPNGDRLVAFKSGTQTLVDALAAQIKAGRVLSRMAVSTLGMPDHQFAVCMENGMVIQAAALIVAAPARYTERMFYNFQPVISTRLLDFHYDTITRVSLGYHKDSIAFPFEPPPDAGFAFGRWTDSEYRVPPRHTLIQVGVRYPLNRTTPEAMIAALQHTMRWPDPVVARVDYWPESHSLNPYHTGHEETMQFIDEHLPEGIALIGSDYRGWRFEDRVYQGRAAARRIVQWLR